MKKYVFFLLLLGVFGCKKNEETTLTGVAAEQEKFTGTINGQPITIKPSRSTQSQSPCFIADTDGNGTFNSKDERSYLLSSSINTVNSTLSITVGALYLNENTNVLNAFREYLIPGDNFSYNNFDNFCVIQNPQSYYNLRVDYFDQTNGMQYSSAISGAFADQGGSYFNITDAYLFKFEGQTLLRIKANLKCKLYSFWGDAIQLDDATFIGSFPLPSV